MEDIFVTIQPHWGKPYKSKVLRITKNWIIVICNDIATLKYRRDDGLAAGGFTRTYTPSRIKELDLNLCNKIVEENGGTWDSGLKKPYKI